MQAGLADGSNGTNGGDIVVGKERSKGMVSSQQILGIGISQFRGRFLRFNLHSQLGIHFYAEFLSHFADCFPTVNRVGAGRITAHEGDPPVSQFGKMAQGEPGSFAMVQNNVGHAWMMAVAGKGDCG